MKNAKRDPLEFANEQKQQKLNLLVLCNCHCNAKSKQILDLVDI